MAKGILEGHELEINARKLKDIFPAELAAIAEHGTNLHGNLFNVFRSLDFVMTCDVQSNEGVNSIIKRMCQRSPSITLPLLSSRLLIKKSLGIAAASGKEPRWSRARPTASAVIKTCISNYSMGQQVVATDAQRWSPPTANFVDDAAVDSELPALRPHARVTPAHQWALPYNILSTGPSRCQARRGAS